VARRPEIPEDVFFDPRPRNRDSEQRDSENSDRLAKSLEPEESIAESASADRRSPVESAAPPKSDRPVEADEDDGGEGSSRLGRPPAQEGPKIAVTLYLTEPVAHRLEEAKFRLLTEYGVKTSKSAVADFAIRHGLHNLAAAAEDLRRD